jgi:hypothetical protein
MVVVAKLRTQREALYKALILLETPNVDPGTISGILLRSGIKLETRQPNPSRQTLIKELIRRLI